MSIRTQIPHGENEWHIFFKVLNSFHNCFAH